MDGKNRRAVADECGLAPEAVMVHVTQTHSAPSLGHFMFDESFQGTPTGDGMAAWRRSAVLRFAFERIVEAIKRANGFFAAGSTPGW